MKLLKRLAISLLVLFVLVGCTSAPDNNGGNTENEKVTITDVHGEVEVVKNPTTVISLDNRTFETLEAWGIELVAVPKDVMPADSSYVLDENVQNIGSHREPNLELIAALNPDLVIVGQRFAQYYDQIKELVPNAAVIDLAFDVSETAEDSGANLVNGFKDTTTALGLIFGKEAEAKALTDEFDAALEAAKNAYNPEDSVISVVISGGNIGFSAPGSGRVWGPLYNVFGWTNALTIDNATSDHQGDDISVEALAQSNPTWLLVLDRDAAVASSDSASAKDVIEGSLALQNTTAVKEGNIVYAPADTYTNESIQTFIELFQSLAEAFSK